MKKSILGLAVLLAAMQVVAKPAIKFKTLAVDFGEVESGQVVDINFEFENAGSDLLIIKNIVPACGCTTAALAKKEYKAGEKGTIASKFNTSGYNGKVIKTITVTSNDAEAAEVRLTLSGTVIIKDIAQADLKPERIDFETVAVGKTYSRKLNLSNNGNSDLRVIEVSCSPEETLLFKTNLVGAKRTTEITLTFTPFAKGPFSNLVKIRTNDYRNPYLIIRVEAEGD